MINNITTDDFKQMVGADGLILQGCGGDPAEWQQKHGYDVRVDHRSYERQGLDILPTVHLGVAASQMERNGIRTEKGDYNRQVKNINKEMRQTKARIHAEEIRLYEKAKEHFDAVMNGRKDLPVAKWHTEQKALTAERFMLAKDYYRLKDEVRSVEVLLRGLKELMQDAVKSEQHKKIRVAL